jgi:hypothetical protein
MQASRHGVGTGSNDDVGKYVFGLLVRPTGDA